VHITCLLGCVIEKYIPLRLVPDLPWLPARRKDSKLAPSTLWRWRTTGVKGVILRTARMGSMWCTTEEWLKEFFEDSAAPNNPAERPSIRTPTRRAREIARTQERLVRAGFSRTVDEAFTECPTECKESSGKLIGDQNSS
jgi:hypothetical protein